MKNIAKDLKDNNYKPFYLLYGDEDYLLNYYKNEFKKRFEDNGGMNMVIYDKENYNLGHFIDTVYKMPFFSDKKLIIIDNVLIDHKKDEDEMFVEETTDENAKKKSKRTIYDILLENEDTNVILMIFDKEEKIDKRSKLYKFFDTNGYVCELSTQDKQVISKFIKNKLANEKKGISTKDAAYLIMKVGTNLSNIMTELEKLVAYVGNRENITKEDIDKVVHESLENRIFLMIKYLNKNDLNNAYNIYADLTLSDTTSSKSTKESIIRLLKNNYNLILSVKSLRARGLSNNDIKNELSIQDYQLRDISEVEKSHDENYFMDKILKLYEYNKRLRNDTIEKDVVIELLMN